MTLSISSLLLLLPVSLLPTKHPVTGSYDDDFAEGVQKEEGERGALGGEEEEGGAVFEMSRRERTLDGTARAFLLLMPLSLRTIIFDCVLVTSRSPSSLHPARHSVLNLTHLDLINEFNQPLHLCPIAIQEHHLDKDRLVDPSPPHPALHGLQQLNTVDVLFAGGAKFSVTGEVSMTELQKACGEGGMGARMTTGHKTAE